MSEPTEPTRQTKWCPRCETGRPIQDFGINRGRKDGLSVYCMECIRTDVRQRYIELRREAVVALGGCCKGCGFDKDERALQFDHVDSDGKHHRSSGQGSGPRFFRQIIAGTLSGKIQMLCANCNQIKVWEANERDGKRKYTREVPTTRIDRPNARWTDEQRQRQSEKTKAQWADPKTRALMHEGQMEAGERPEVRAARSRGASENMKRRWASGEIPSRRREVPTEG